MAFTETLKYKNQLHENTKKVINRIILDLYGFHGSPTHFPRTPCLRTYVLGSINIKSTKMTNKFNQLQGYFIIHALSVSDNN